MLPNSTTPNNLSYKTATIINAVAIIKPFHNHSNFFFK